MKQEKVWILVFVVLLGSLAPIAQASVDPTFVNVNNNRWFNLTQDVPFLYYIIATDTVELDYPINFTHTTEGQLFQSFMLRNYNSTAAIMNFTPRNHDVGDPAVGLMNYTIYVVAEDTRKDFSTVRLYFRVANVNDPPNITWWFPQQRDVHTVENSSVPFHFNYTTTDVDIPWGDVLNASWYLDHSLESSSRQRNGSWIYLADFCSGGNHNVSLVVRDLNGSTDIHNWSLTINNSNRLPVFNRTISNMTWPEDTNLEHNLSLSSHFYDLDYSECSGVNKDLLRYSVAGNNHVSVIINETSFTVSFRPESDWFGTEVVRFTLNDTRNITESNFVRLNVTNVNDPPVLAFIPNQSLAVGVPFEYFLNATDVDGDVLHYYSNSSIITVDEHTGLINLTPSGSDIGIHFVLLSVNDSVLAVSQLVKFAIQNNTAPYITPIQDQIGSEDVAFYTTVNASDVDGDNLTFSDNATIFNITTVRHANGSATGVISFTPKNRDVGSRFVKITVRDTKGAVNSTVFNFTILDFNHPPTFPLIPAVKIKINHSINFNVTATDEDEDDVLTFGDNASFFDIDPANHVSAAFSSTPINVTNLSFVGIHYVNISVHDDDPLKGWHSQKVRFSISVNSIPRIYPLAPANATEDTLFTLFVNAFDADEDVLTFDNNASLFNITSFNATAGLINFTPKQMHAGNHSILINVTDGYGGYNTTVLSLYISEVNDPPFFVNLQPNYTLLEDSNSLLYIVGYDEENATLTMWSNNSLFALTRHNSTTFLLNLTPLQRDVGNHLVNFTLTDGAYNVSQLVVFHILNVNDPPVIVSYLPVGALVSVAENSSLLFNVTNATDEDGDVITFRYYVNSIPKSGNRSFLYSPGFCEAGNYNVTVVAMDPYNGTGSVSWNLTVNNTNRGPFLNRSLPNLTWPEDTNLVHNFTLTDFFYDPDFHECNGSNKDNLSYAVHGNYHVLVHIGPGSFISLYPSADWNGAEHAYFSLADTHNLVNSNNLTLKVTPVNDPPSLRSIPAQELQVGQLATIYVNATDVDGDRLFFDDNTSFFNVTNMSLQLGLINFTVLSSMVGNQTVNISVNDGYYWDSMLVLFNFNGTNLPPEMRLVRPYGWPLANRTVFSFANASLFPYGTRINLSENMSVLFNHTSVDPDNDQMTYRWLLNGTLLGRNHSWRYDVDWFDSGFNNVTLVVSDRLGQQDSFYWNVSVRNVNRLPTYGVKTFTDYEDFLEGTLLRANLTRQFGNVTLARKNVTTYYSNGSFVSRVIDFQTGATSSLARPNLTVLRWKAAVPAGTNLTFQTRTSANVIVWSNWTKPYTNSSRSFINFTHNFVQNASPATWNTRYLEYRANLGTRSASSTPVMESVDILYEIAEFATVQGYSISDWIDLDDYFNDKDNDTLIFNATNVQNLDYLRLSIDANHQVDLNPQSDWYGTARFRIRASDGSLASNNSPLYSNIITVNVMEAPKRESPSSGSGGGSSRTITVTRTKLENITQPVSMELIVPKPLVVSSDLEILAPIQLRNSGNLTLRGINLKASTSEPNVTLQFSKSFFNQLAPKDQTETLLTITSSVKRMSSYQINVTAESTEPHYKDSALISINPLPLPESLNDSIRFVRDLLTNNPECLELNELLEEANTAIGQHEYEYAQQILTKSIDACRYLISAKRNLLEQPAVLTPAEVMRSFIMQNLLPISLIITVAIALITYSAIVIRRHRVRKT